MEAGKKFEIFATLEAEVSFDEAAGVHVARCPALGLAAQGQNDGYAKLALHEAINERLGRPPRLGEQQGSVSRQWESLRWCRELQVEALKNGQPDELALLLEHERDLMKLLIAESPKVASRIHIDVHQ